MRSNRTGRRWPVPPPGSVGCSIILAFLGLGLQQPCRLRAAEPLNAAGRSAHEATGAFPGLSRILLLGDAVSTSYAGPATRILRKSVVVNPPSTQCGSTSRALENLYACLGAGRWDVIHFNWGLEDIAARPGDGNKPVPVDQYEKNLRTLVERLKVTGAMLIWATTTPVPEEIKVGPLRRNSDVIAYNTLARKVMEEHEIIIDDLHSFTAPRLIDLQTPGDVRFTSRGSELLGDQVARSILGARAAAAWKKVQEMVTVEAEDDPSLPRVLLIGDSISFYYTLPTRNLLKGRANVHRAPFGGSTSLGVEKISGWLGAGKWDVIHFNWGLHDLAVHQRNGGNAVPLDQYKINLRKLVERLKATGAALIWATTTPVPDEIRVGPLRRNKDVIAYNAAARKIMEQNKIIIDDLYALAFPGLSELQWPDDVHFTDEGSETLAQQVTDSILAAVKK